MCVLIYQFFWVHTLSLSHSKLLSYLNKSQDKRFDITDRDGLSVRVSESGRITFQYRYRFKGKPVRMSIGRFPDITLSQARDKIPELRLLVSEGKDPCIEIKRQSKKDHAYLHHCIELFLERHVSKLRTKTQNLYQYSLNRHAINAFEIPVEDIGIHEWYEYFDKIEDTVSLVAAQDLLIRLKTCLRFCIKRNLISNSTILMISPRDVGKSSQTGDRVVSPEEVKVIWRELAASKCYPTTKNTIKLASLTGARLGEVRHMEIGDLDLKNRIWRIPKEKSKTKVAFIRPLAPMAFEIIQWQITMFGELTPFVFPSGSYKKQISPQTVNKLCRLIIKRSVMERWSCHDFRRSLSTILSAKGVELHVTEKMLGHSLGGILAVYNKHDWLKEQRKAYELWESLIV